MDKDLRMRRTMIGWTWAVLLFCSVIWGNRYFSFEHTHKHEHPPHEHEQPHEYEHEHPLPPHKHGFNLRGDKIDD